MKIKQLTAFDAPKKLKRKTPVRVGKAMDWTNGDWLAVRELLRLCNQDVHERERHARDFIAQAKHKATPMRLLDEWQRYGQPRLPGVEG